MAEDEKADGRGRVIPRSDEVVLARTRLYYLLTIVISIPIACAGLGLFALMSVPLAHVLAGKHTDFTLTMSFSFNAVLTATTVLGGTALAIQTKRASRHKSRALELEKKVKQQDDDSSSAKI